MKVQYSATFPPLAALSTKFPDIFFHTHRNTVECESECSSHELKFESKCQNSELIIYGFNLETVGNRILDFLYLRIPMYIVYLRTFLKTSTDPNRLRNQQFIKKCRICNI